MYEFSKNFPRILFIIFFLAREFEILRKILSAMSSTRIFVISFSDTVHNVIQFSSTSSSEIVRIFLEFSRFLQHI